MLQFLEHKVHCFKAGGLKQYYNQWQALTSDLVILQMILGQPIEFTRTPYQRIVPREKTVIDLDEQPVIDTEIDKLLDKGVITPGSHEEGKFICPIFTRAKKDGSFRVILNLKCLNTHVQYHHFKTDSLNTVLQMVKPGCFMASIDLKDAYYSVPIATADQKYLKFQWRGKLYKYVCFQMDWHFAQGSSQNYLSQYIYIYGSWGTFQQVILMTHIARLMTMMTVKEMLGILSNYFILLGLLYTLKNHPLFHNNESPSWVLLKTQLQ